ncbi:hypothetical protein FBR43_09285 [Sphingomonas baiyangensis]|uniref:Uncharacterized protein n=2 Tax=Sphingomonas baiyangensis TaxID=2572576 RepID=A0A4U1L5H0_9SPHN|nr:hypothetical protein FBR43_09285 [Sphingomonas baiyangensis]
MLRFGLTTGAVVLLAMPLFEEANRTRALIVTMLRALAEHGIGAALPDLPGTGESLVPTEAARLEDWRAAFAAAEEQVTRGGGRVHIASLRGGALVDTRANCAGRWHFAPVAGAALVRDLMRARQASAREAGEPFDPAAIAPGGPPVELAGNLLAPELIDELKGAVPTAAAPLRTVRLLTEAAAADHKIAARPLWRRAEPENNPALARELAADLAAWVKTCGG